MKNKVLIIDGNNLMHRALNVFNLSYNGKSTSIIYGFLNILRSLIVSHSANLVYVVFDGGKSKYRLSIHPDYKKRDKGSDFDYKDFKRQRDEIVKVLKILCVPVLRKKDQEADDIIFLLARRLKRKNYITIVSTDKDFHQIISSTVSIWNTYMNKRISKMNLLKLKGYEPNECVDWLILMGDKSDNIEGLNGMGKVKTRKFLDEYGSIENYLKSDCEQFGKFDKKTVEEVFLRNRRLIDLRIHARRTKTSFKSLGFKLKPENSSINLSKLKLFISKHGLISLSKDSFIKAFKKLKYD